MFTRLSSVLLALLLLAASCAPPFTPSGSVDIGGRSVYYSCHGTGSPPVVVETRAAAAGTEDFTWSKVIEAIAATNQICFYDRAGLGQSDPLEAIRTSQDVVDDLHSLVSKARIDTPFVLVGHSLGGMFATHYAAVYPNDVLGLVLVDSLHPDFFPRFTALMPTPSGEARTWLQDLRTKERLDFESSADQVKAVTSLGDTPLIVITARYPASPDDPRFPSGAPQQLAPLWGDLQSDLAALSSSSTLVNATTRNHFVQQSEPQVVIDAIRAILGRVEGS